ncbi:WSC domain-containing protein, partial [Mucidula mucida]
QRTMTGMFFEDHSLTSESCIAACSSNGYSYAGTQYYFQCFCSNSLAITGHTVGASECNTPCDGTTCQTCGGPYRLSVFQKQTITPTATLPSGWSVDQNCVEDGSTRIMQGYQSSSSSNTPANCAADCSSRGYSLAGVQNGNECYCANAYARSPPTKPSSDCSTPCTGDISQTCGGGWRMATYKSSSTATPPSTTTWTLAHTCLVDSSARVLTTYSTSSTTNTPASCTALCASKGYTLAGLEDGRECYCASSYNTAAGLTAGDGCTTPCTGDSTQKCGGGWRISVYESPSYVPPSTTPATIPSDWSLIHACAVDGSTRLLGGASISSSLNTPAWCATHCRDAGFTLAGVEYGLECHCSNAYSYTPVDASSADCNMPCAGDSSKTCGAGWRV